MKVGHTAVGYYIIFTIAFLVCLFYGLLFVSAAENDCLQCHDDLIKGKFKHVAAAVGCRSCHTGIDATEVPHKKTNSIVRGLATGQPELCFGCHESSDFNRKNVHAAVGMGCTSCHNPHSSMNKKLLSAPLPETCFVCHDKAGFRKKHIHGPADAGMCLACHAPHSSDLAFLLLKKPVEVCLACHGDIRQEIHIVHGFKYGGHPVGVSIQRTGLRVRKSLRDPARPGRPFYCGSCHNPHGSDMEFLIRFAAESPLKICIYCHRKQYATSHIP